MKGSDNAFPSILIEDHVDPAAPADGYHRLFIDTDEKLKMIDHASLVTDFTPGAGGSVATDAIWDAAGDLAVGTGADTAAKLTKGAAGAALVSGASTVSWVDILPWHVSIIPMIATADAMTGAWVNASFTDSAIAYPFYMPGSTANSGGAGAFLSAGAQNDAVAWDVILAAGTWDAHFWVRRASNAGIITLNQDGASQGTVDTYAGAVAAAKVSISGWTVAATGKKRMQILMATKHASSSGYYAELFAIEFCRTA
jgi:hypothetical protein